MKANTLKITLFIVFAFFLNQAHSQIFVNLESTTGENTGTSWQNAYTDLQDALDKSHSKDTIWVAEGVYYPTRIVQGSDDTNPRNMSFHISGKNLVIYGGFSGKEKKISERDIANYPTVFSGDFNGDDVIQNSTSDKKNLNNHENAYHVFILSEVGHSTLDGVTITGGNANDNGGFFNYGGLLLSSSRGGGIYSKNNSNSSRIKIVNCLINGNSSAYLGGGIFSDANDSTFIELINSIVSNNTSSSQGGGIYSSSFSGSHIKLTNTMVSNNVSFMGGGIYSYSGPFSSVILNNSTVSSNIADVGAGIFSYSLTLSSVSVDHSTIDNNVGLDAAGGILSASELYSTVSIVNSKVSKNSAYEGGGILSESYNPSSTSSVVITNSTISNNLANEGSGILSINYDSSSSSTIAVASSIIWTAPGSGSNISNNGSPIITSKGNNVFSDTPIGILKSDSINVTNKRLEFYSLIDLANNLKANSKNGNTNQSAEFTNAYNPSDFHGGDFVSVNKNGTKRFGPQSLSDNLKSEDDNDSLANILVNTIGLEHFMGVPEVSVNPIPSSERVNVFIENVKDSQYILELQDATGRLLSELIISKSSTDINLGQYQRGIYFIRISNNNRHSIFRLIKD